MIDPRLQVLRVLAGVGTLTEVARRLAYTPSAVSHQLRTLSQDLGVRLVEPRGRGLVLTRAGQLLPDRSRELVTRWEAVRGALDEMDSGATPRRRQVRRCGFTPAAATLLPPTALASSEHFPGAEVTIIEAEPEECFDLLVSEHADVAVDVANDPLPPRGDSRFEQSALFSDRLDLLVPTNHS